MNRTIFVNTTESQKMSKNHNQISITDLMGDAVENAIARREQKLSSEETKQIKGGLVTTGGRHKPRIRWGKETK